VLPLTTLLRSLGNSGAVANVQSVLEDRRREDWVIEGLSRRIAPAPLPAALPARPAAVA
jgi:hypothetical protein